MTGYNFSDRARRGLQLAREEATFLGHEYVGTEHVLLGLLSVGGVALTALEALPLSAAELRDAVITATTAGQPTLHRRDLPYTARAKKVLELAMREARELHHTYVGTEHLLLGLVREEKGIAAQALLARGATADRIRAEVLRLLGTPDWHESGDRERVTPLGPVSVTILVEQPHGPIVAAKFADIANAMAYLANLRGQQAAS